MEARWNLKILCCEAAIPIFPVRTLMYILTDLVFVVLFVCLFVCLFVIPIPSQALAVYSQMNKKPTDPTLPAGENPDPTQGGASASGQTGVEGVTKTSHKAEKSGIEGTKGKAHEVASPRLTAADVPHFTAGSSPTRSRDFF